MRGGASVSLPPVLENLYNYLGALQVSLLPQCARVLVPISRVPAPYLRDVMGVCQHRADVT